MKDFSSFEDVLEAMKRPMPKEIEKLQPAWWVLLRKKFSAGEVSENEAANRQN